IARISLAAAIAAGEPGLSGVVAAGAFFCCASAGTAVRASPTARPAADKIRERLFITISPRLPALPPLNYANSLGTCQDGGAGQANEQPVFDDTRDQAQQARQTRRIHDAPEMGIDNPVAAIGDKNVAVLALAFPGKCRGQGPLGSGQPERNYLHR